MDDELDDFLEESTPPTAEQEADVLFDEVPGRRRPKPEEPPEPDGGEEALPIAAGSPSLADLARFQLAVGTPQPSGQLSPVALTVEDLRALQAGDPAAKAKVDALVGSAPPAPAAQQLPAGDEQQWSLLALSDFPWLRDQTGAQWQKFQNQLNQLRAQGYRGPDLKYMAAQLVDGGPRREKQQESDRTRRAAAGGDFRPRPKPKAPPGSKAGAALGPLMAAKAAELGIDTPEGLASFREEMSLAKRRAEGYVG